MKCSVAGRVSELPVSVLPRVPPRSPVVPWIQTSSKATNIIEWMRQKGGSFVVERIAVRWEAT